VFVQHLGMYLLVTALDQQFINCLLSRLWSSQPSENNSAAATGTTRTKKRSTHTMVGASYL
ncbi:hypothetical protein, partial [Weissella sp. DD23]|uniref:hypothetical protein n=1 Tax=Weissella sp. DD23 TaxID=1777865 RepID=UPI001A9A4A94